LALSDIKATAEKILSGSLGIINYMKYSSSRVVVNRQPVNLYDVAQEACNKLVMEVTHKHIKLKNDISNFIFVKVDEIVFNLILINAISSSIEHFGSNEIEISAQTKPESPSEIVLTIKDNGTAIDHDRLIQIRKLLKGDIEAIKAISKTSSGLAYILISELARIHELAISIESVANTGTTVSVVIPVYFDNVDLQ